MTRPGLTGACGNDINYLSLRAKRGNRKEDGTNACGCFVVPPRNGERGL
jgi:hypothetical protein